MTGGSSPVQQLVCGRIVLIGDSSVGKTCMISRLIENRSNAAERPTIGANYQLFGTECDGVRVQLQIWDTAGQEKYRSLGPIYFRNAVGAVVVYDVSVRETFVHLDEWISSFVNVAGPETTLFIVGNKTDMAEYRQVTVEEGEAVAKEYNGGFFETSAQTGDGVQELFMAVAGSLVDKGKDVVCHQSRPPERKKSCC